MNQLSLFNHSRGAVLADTGIKMAVDHADAVEPKWSETAWQLFWQWLNRKPQYFEFMIEDFREYCYSYDLLTRPPSERAFGFLANKAVKMGLIFSSGTATVKNAKAHKANAGKWVKK